MYKKLNLAFLSMIIYSLTFSQINYGLKAGVTESFLQDKIGGTSQNYDLRTGFQIGAFAEIPIRKNFNLRPSLQLTQKGFKQVEGTPGTAFYWNRNFSTSYLELALDVVYNFHLNKSAAIQIGTGPVFGIGLFGKNKTIITVSDSAQQTHTEYWVGHDAFSKTFDFGWDFLIGFKCHRISINANYNNGLFNLLNDGDHTAKNRSFALTLGYLLKK
ncbi:MAG TPA: outer membrane beta-barrel protein [Chitinophagaceae bacterium]|nr:outer membrane beta-barrel protein [Chitinophagaceae bacterium]